MVLDTASTPDDKLSYHQIATRIKEGKWWPFDRVDGKILTRMQRETERESVVNEPEALF